ncbi:GNAT family N-acetyltransferase [Amycolatopsis jiangsuensis]|uniref:RimJ/RimL family protein N-acetyltransferase n=1 Tax=Amycolatopsis jiangsuensis TaxID=1181879 RepID=A0A840J6B9_9PSEU|nr:GNAT family N-acetyltransferase [Amycolatopsis jiangsuensis]MBB4688954.1 RimJ/RimL family protein N-acetyltransferase [Amycolatopsis jiangsuensis]
MDTERLRLTPIGPQSADELYDLHTDPGIVRWYGQWTRADAQARATDIGHGWNTDGAGKWLAHHRETGELIGRGGLSYQDVEGARSLEIGWALREIHWGDGYATEIGRAGLAYAFETLGAPEVVSFTETHNVRSRAVMERLGFTYLRESAIAASHSRFTCARPGNGDQPVPQIPFASPWPRVRPR